MAEMEKVYPGRCFCGAVQLTVTGAPEAMGFCHCTSCRHWSAGPINAFSLWSPAAVKVVRGGEQLGAYQKTANSVRKFCSTCGGHVFTEHPQWNLIDVYAAIIPEFRFQPAVHVNYQEKVLPIADGLPKFKDLPKEMGGSGEMLPE